VRDWPATPTAIGPYVWPLIPKGVLPPVVDPFDQEKFEQDFVSAAM
jgi:hypothetical protein